MKVAFKIRAKNGILQKFIDDRGWTQADFARAVGVSFGVVGHWFNMTQVPGSLSMAKICYLVGRLEEDIFPLEVRCKTFQKRAKITTFYHDTEAQLEPGFEKRALMAANPEEKILKDDRYERLQTQIDTLPENMQRVLRYRYLEDKTLEETAELLNLSRERIRQIESKALRYMRHPTRSVHIKP